MQRDAQAFRLENLKAQIQRFESQKAFAEAAGINYTYLSQLLRRRKKIGDESARKIEAALGLGRGWMDRDRSPTADVDPYALDPELVETMHTLRQLPETTQLAVRSLIWSFSAMG